MKKVEELTLNEIQTYLARVGRLKGAIGRGYKLFWPFNTWSPFSLARLILNVMVLVTWGLTVHWLTFRPSSQTDLLTQLGWMWAAVLAMTLLIALIERHFRIKSRYRALTMEQTPPFSKPPPKGVDPIFHYGKEVFRRFFR